MTPLFELPPTSETPLIRIDPSTGLFLMKGICIPEDTPGFFGKVMTLYTEAIEKLTLPAVFRFELRYFNSSSLKGIYMLMKKMENSSKDGNEMRIEWVMDGDDDDLIEYTDLLSSGICLPMTLIRTS